LELRNAKPGTRPKGGSPQDKPGTRPKGGSPKDKPGTRPKGGSPKDKCEFKGEETGV